MPARSPFPADLEQRPFTVAEALGRGVSARVLEGPRFTTPHRGVRVPAALPPSRAVDLVAASLALPRHAAFSGWTAVELMGLPTPRFRSDPGGGRITVASAAGSPIRVDGLICTTGLDPARTRTARRGLLQDAMAPLLAPGVRGLRVQEPVDLWCDLAPALPRIDGVALGDAVRRHWASERDFDDAVAVRDGRRGVVALRALRREVRWRVDSPMETEVRLVLVDSGLPEPLCGRALREGGAFFGLVDMVWLSQRVVLEFDGDVHRTERDQWQWDKAKRRRLRDAGWTVLEVVADDVRCTPGELVDEVRRALAG